MTRQAYSKSNDQAGRWLKKKESEMSRSKTRKRKRREAAERKIVRQAENKI